LGIGSDGHTASLFPDSPALNEQKRWVVDVRAPLAPPVRLTLTLSVLNHATAIFFLVSGAGKASALWRALTEPSRPTLPAGCVRPVGGEPVWWVDEPAAALVRRDIAGQ